VWILNFKSAGVMLISMSYPPELIKYGFVDRVTKCLRLEDATEPSDSELNCSRERFKLLGKSYNREVFASGVPDPLAVIAMLELLEHGVAPEYFECTLSGANISAYKPVLSLFALVRREQGSEAGAHLPSWLRDLEQLSREWGLLANVLLVCFKIGQSCGFFLNPALNFMSANNVTLAEAFDAIYGPMSWSDFRSELIGRTWNIVGYSSKEAAMEAVGSDPLE
jgi:hypothetical protein